MRHASFLYTVRLSDLTRRRSFRFPERSTHSRLLIQPFEDLLYDFCCKTSCNKTKPQSDPQIRGETEREDRPADGRSTGHNRNHRNPVKKTNKKTASYARQHNEAVLKILARPVRNRHDAGSLNNIWLNNSQDCIESTSLCVDVQVDRFGKIQTEDTHDRFGIDHISSGNQIKIAVEFADLCSQMPSLYRLSSEKSLMFSL